MEQKEENLENARECKKVCKEFKKIIINFLKEWGIVIIMILGFSILAITYLNYYYDYHETIHSNNPHASKMTVIQSLGQAGDFLGGTLNPLFAFFSFCLLLFTIKLQSEELNNSTKELAKSSIALTEQSKSLQLQNFENTFFNMINLHNEIVDNLSLIMMKKHFYYRDASIFNITYKNREDNKKYVYSILNHKVSIEEDKDYNGRKTISKLFDICDAYIDLYKSSLTINELYDNFYQEYNEIIGHYFRNIYQILKFIDNKDFTKMDDSKNKKFYTNILRAQLSSKELALLLINSLSNYGKDKLFPLLVEYEFMEPLPLIYNEDNLSDSQIIHTSYLEILIGLCITYTKQINEDKKTDYKTWKIFGESKEESKWEKYIKSLNN